MAWSETMFIIQHFYNVFDIDKRLTDVEYKAPLIAKNINGSPENIDISTLTPGTLWFIQESDSTGAIKSVTALKEDHTFADPIPLGTVLTTVPVNKGGTGQTTIGENKVLVGASGNTFKEVGFDTTPTLNSKNFLNSGTVFNELQKFAIKNHASSTQSYGVGSSTNYGHLKITDSYEGVVSTDASQTAVSLTGIQDLASKVKTFEVQSNTLIIR